MSRDLLSLLQINSINLRRLSLIHAQIITTSLSRDDFVASKLIKAYCNLGYFDLARKMFDEFPNPNVCLSNAIITGYLKNERYDEAVRAYKTVTACYGKVDIDTCTCSSALKACTVLSDFETGFDILGTAVELGIDADVFFGSSAINFLVRYGSVDEARRLFDGLPRKDVVCWNAMIGGYVHSSNCNMAFQLFFEMYRTRIKPTTVTMTTLIQASGSLGDLELGMCVHAHSLVLGMGTDDVLLLTSLLDMYHRLGHSQLATRVFNNMPFRNLVSWNAMISGYVQNDLVADSFNTFRSLVATTGYGFDSTSLVSLLQGCSQIADIGTGKILHGYIVRQILESNHILSTALINFYVKCGALEQATFIFDSIKERNVVTWTSLLVGFAQNGHAKEALKLFRQMQAQGVTANSITFVGLLHSCAHMGYLKKGRSIHAHLLRHSFNFDEVSITALIDMYSKCGEIKHAFNIFKASSLRDVALWNSMITGYGLHGHGHQATALFRNMTEEGIRPNQTTFLVLLSACSHSGLVDEGMAFFSRMEDYGISPTEKHFACAVDLLSRAGRLVEAEKLIMTMPFEPGSAVFEALLSGCQTHKNVEMGIRTADKLIELKSMNPGMYVILSNIYASSKRWDSVDYVRELMRTQGLKKSPGFSSIEIRNKTHAFFAGDDSHPNWDEIYQLLENLRLQVENLGYAPDTSCVLRDVDEQMKIKLLWCHSERLAIAFGLLSTSVGSTIKVTKNLRVCNDCHIVTKYISKIVQREIIVRDANRFHRFFNGQCSCGDYW